MSKLKHKPVNACHCLAYPFPHARWKGKCHGDPETLESLPLDEKPSIACLPPALVHRARRKFVQTPPGGLFRSLLGNRDDEVRDIANASSLAKRQFLITCEEVEAQVRKDGPWATAARLSSGFSWRRA